MLVMAPCPAVSDETGEAPAGTAIYKKNPTSDAAMVDTMGPVVETEMVKLNDTQPDTVEDADAVSGVQVFS